MRIYYGRSLFKKNRTRILKRMIDDETWYRIWVHKKNVISRAIHDIIILWRLISILDIIPWDFCKYEKWMTFFYILFHINIYIYIYIYIWQLSIDHDKKRSSCESTWFRSFESCSDSSVNSYWWSILIPSHDC